MGYAVAEAAVARGHDTVLISGPVSLEPIQGARLLPVESALDMLAAVEENLGERDLLVMAAAVGDWRPAEPSGRKLKKGDMPSQIRLVRNPDILMQVRPRKGSRAYVAFAAETEELEERATAKLREKGVDLVVANNVLVPGAGFGVATNKVTWVTKDGAVDLPLMTKKALAHRIVEWAEARVGG